MTFAPPSSKHRTISIPTLLSYAIGQIAVSTKDTLFHYFFLLFFATALGLPATLVGAAAFLALIVDAMSDPVLGGISDNFRSKTWGRRHGFMAAAALPLALSIALLFSPPSGLSQIMLIVWMGGFAIAVRVFLSFFYVPYIAMNAELTNNFEARTFIASLRILFGNLAGTALFAVFFLVVLRDTPNHPDGQLNVDAYKTIGISGALIAGLAIFIAVFGTKPFISTMRIQYMNQPKMAWYRVFAEIRKALFLNSYRRLALGYVFVSILLGVITGLTIYMFAYFWGFSKPQIFGLACFAGLAVIPGALLANILTKKIEKRRTLLVALGGVCCFHTLPVLMAITGVLPASGSQALFIIVGIFLFLTQVCGVITNIVAQSMMADVADEYAFISGQHQQAGLFAAITFAQKMTFGIGTLFAGIILDLVHFPAQTLKVNIPAQTITNLGASEALAVVVLSGLAIFFWSGYELDKKRHIVIQTGLAGKASGDGNRKDSDPI